MTNAKVMEVLEDGVLIKKGGTKLKLPEG